MAAARCRLPRSGSIFGSGQVALLTLLAVPVKGHPVAMTGLNVPVEAVVRRIERPVGEPPVERSSVTPILTSVPPVTIGCTRTLLSRRPNWSASLS
jgi:hypothetical protein